MRKLDDRILPALQRLCTLLGNCEVTLSRHNSITEDTPIRHDIQRMKNQVVCLRGEKSQNIAKVS